MNEFAQRSQEIDKIILVINSIAEQIQILALNARPSIRFSVKFYVTRVTVTKKYINYS